MDFIERAMGAVIKEYQDAGRDTAGIETTITLKLDDAGERDLSFKRLIASDNGRMLQQVVKKYPAYFGGMTIVEIIIVDGDLDYSAGYTANHL